MLVAFFEPSASSACACDEHSEILGALLQGDAGRAIKAMHTHLSLIETRLGRRAANAETAADPDAELRRAWRETQRVDRAGRCRRRCGDRPSRRVEPLRRRAGACFRTRMVRFCTAGAP
jgi:hypothetical protein